MGKMRIIIMLIAIGGIGCVKATADGGIHDSDSGVNNSEIMAAETTQRMAQQQWPIIRFHFSGNTVMSIKDHHTGPVVQECLD